MIRKFRAGLALQPVRCLESSDFSFVTQANFLSKNELTQYIVSD